MNCGLNIIDMLMLERTEAQKNTNDLEETQVFLRSHEVLDVSSDDCKINVMFACCGFMCRILTAPDAWGRWKFVKYGKAMVFYN